MYFHLIHACCMPFPLHLPQFGRMQIMKLPIIQFFLAGIMNLILIFRHSLLVFIALIWFQVMLCRAVKSPKHPCNSSWEDEYRLSTTWFHPFPPHPPLTNVWITTWMLPFQASKHQLTSFTYFHSLPQFYITVGCFCWLTLLSFSQPILLLPPTPCPLPDILRAAW